MHAPLTRRASGRCLVVLLLATLATSACSTPLPRLEKYDSKVHANRGDTSRTEWRTGPDRSAQATIALLENDSDELVREQAHRAFRGIKELETQRLQRREELLDSSIGESEFLSEVALVGIDRSMFPGEIGPKDVRELLALQALEAEAEGRVGDALRLANTAIAIEWTIQGRNTLEKLPADPREIGRRNTRRLALVRLASPKVARRLEAGTHADEYDEELDLKPVFVDLRSRRAAIADAAALVERMKLEHVEKPKLSDLHIAGINEVIIVCAILDDNGIEISSEFMNILADSLIKDVHGRTMPLLVLLDGAQQEHVGDVLPDGFTLRAFAEGAAGSLDKRTSIVWPDEFANYNRTGGRRYRGIGATVSKRADGSVKLDPLPGGPARRAGMRSGDLVLEIEGIPVSTLDLSELTNIATDPKRDSVTLLVMREDGSRRELVIELGSVTRPHASGWRQEGVDETGQPRWDWLADTVTRTAYIRLDGFRALGDRAIRLALKEAQAQARLQGGRLEGLVLDLRANGGGAVQIAEEVANLFLRSGAIFRTTGGNQLLHDEHARASHSELAGMPLVILVDERSASASELVAGLLQVRADALVLGDHTYGKGSIQSSFRAFSNDCLLLVTIGWYLLPPRSDDPFEEWRAVDRAKAPGTWGVAPDVLVPMSVEETDASLAHRMRWFSGLGADQPDDAGEIAPDPALELALALIRARVLDAERPLK